MILLSVVAVAPCKTEGQFRLYVSNHDSGLVSTYDAGTGNVTDPDFITTSGQPHGILQIGGELLVASWGVSSRISRYDGSSGAFLGIFADSSSQLDQPVDLVLGPDNMLWVSSQANGRVNRYDPVTGAVQTPFISSESHLTNPSGMTFSADGTRCFVTDRADGEVLEYDAATGTYVRTIADFSGPAFGIEWGPDDKLYVASGGLRQIDPNAPFTATLVAGGDFAIGVEVGPDGDVFFADYNLDRLRRFDPETMTDLGIYSDDAALIGPNFFHFGVPEPSTAMSGAIALLIFAVTRNPWRPIKEAYRAR
ncbi:MAG TPA: hypothetical protein VFG14_20935 [Chthoniobacteraceae bacterium]|nr:hypothetical protein [Chthoniobacteraceae bacterium]